MADFDTGDVVRIAAYMRFKATDDIVNTWTFQITAAGGFTYAAGYSKWQTYMDLLYAAITAPLSNSVLPNYLTVENLTQGTVGGSFAWGSFTGGASGGDPTAAQVACLGFGRTLVPRVQIRKYVGVFTETDMTNGLWLSTVTTPVSNMLGIHIVGTVIGGGTTVQGCAYNAPLTRVTFANSPHASATPVIQRRRREGRGS